jgi:molybdate/tungstate transport system substrate-binding protein
MQLAARYYRQPRLADQILGPQINPQQIFPEAQMMARLQTGQLDASAAYKSQPAALALPFIALPGEINLGDSALEPSYRAATVVLNGRTLHPSPLVFYAGVLKDAPQPKLAAQFLAWLQSSEARQLFARYHYDPPGAASPLAP